MTPAAPVGGICPACHGCGFDNPAIATSPCLMCGGNGHDPTAPVGDDAELLRVLRIFPEFISVDDDLWRMSGDDERLTQQAAARIESQAARIAELERALADAASELPHVSGTIAHRIRVYRNYHSDCHDAALRQLADAERCIRAADACHMVHTDSRCMAYRAARAGITLGDAAQGGKP